MRQHSASAWRGCQLARSRFHIACPERSAGIPIIYAIDRLITDQVVNSSASQPRRGLSGISWARKQIAHISICCHLQSYRVSALRRQHQRQRSASAWRVTDPRCCHGAVSSSCCHEHLFAARAKCSDGRAVRALDTTVQTLRRTAPASVLGPLPRSFDHSRFSCLPGFCDCYGRLALARAVHLLFQGFTAHRALSLPLRFPLS